MYIFARRSFLILAAVATGLSPAGAAVISSQIEVPMMRRPPVVDGKLSAEEKADCVSVPLQKNASLEAPTFATTVYVGATLQGLYVGFVANESHLDQVVGAETLQNGAVFKNDSVQVFVTPTIDTMADEYYHFAVNPFGVPYSANLAQRTSVSGWQVGTSKQSENNSTKGTWEAEFFIPLKTINAPDELPIWRANFARYRPERNGQPAETSAWQDTGISLFNYKKFGYLKMPRFVPAPPGGITTDAGDQASTATPESSSSAVLISPAPSSVPESADSAAMPVSQPAAP